MSLLAFVKAIKTAYAAFEVQARATIGASMATMPRIVKAPTVRQRETLDLNRFHHSVSREFTRLSAHGELGGVAQNNRRVSEQWQLPSSMGHAGGKQLTRSTA